MKKFIKIVALGAMSLSLCACKMSAQTTKSKTGMISVEVKNESVTLNHVEYEFPEGYKLEDGLMKDPYGISYVNVYNDDEDLIGAAGDGMYEEDIDEDNFTDAASEIVKEFHDTDEDLTFYNDDPVNYGDKLGILMLEIDDGYALFIAEIGTPNFVYVTQSEDDEDDEMSEFVESVVEQLGSDEDYEIFFGE